MAWYSILSVSVLGGAAAIFWYLYREAIRDYRLLLDNHATLRRAYEELDIKAKLQLERHNLKLDDYNQLLKEQNRRRNECFEDLQKLAKAGEHDPSVRDAVRRITGAIFVPKRTPSRTRSRDNKGRTLPGPTAPKTPSD